MNPKNKRILRVGTRRSALAKSQANRVIEQLQAIHPHLQIKVIEIVTTGDRILDSSLSRLPGKGVFVKEIEDKLLQEEIDVAVHSMKDLPTDFPPGLILGAVSQRVDPRDVFITRFSKNLEDMPDGAVVGTGSLRRQVQLRAYRADLQVRDIRGNIDTRLKKSETEQYDGIILAAAGLARMNWLECVQQYLSCEVMIPAVGQGALGIETRVDDQEVLRLLQPLNDVITEQAVLAERRFLHQMGGGCQTPMAAFCRVRNGGVLFHAFCADEDGGNFRKEKIAGHLKDAFTIADELVQRLRSGAKQASQS